MKAPRRLSGSRIAVGVASVGLTVGAFSLYSRKRYGRSAAASLAEYGVRPVKTLAARIPMTERIARLADRPEPARTITFPAWGRFFYDLERREDSGMPVYHVRPRTPSSAVIVYLHGGAYVSPISWAHWLLIDALVERTGAAAVVPAYPRAPEHTAAEAFAPLGVLMDQVLDAPGRAVLAGDSAGGGLALSLAIQRRDAGVRAPDGLVLFSPWVDVSMSNPRIAPMVRLDPMLGIDGLVWCGKEWAGGLGTADPRVSPLHDHLRGLPPTRVYQGDRDILLPDVELFARKARARGAERERADGGVGGARGARRRGPARGGLSLPRPRTGAQRRG